VALRQARILVADEEDEVRPPAPDRPGGFRAHLAPLRGASFGRSGFVPRSFPRWRAGVSAWPGAVARPRGGPGPPSCSGFLRPRAATGVSFLPTSVVLKGPHFQVQRSHRRGRPARRRTSSTSSPPIRTCSRSWLVALVLTIVRARKDGVLSPGHCVALVLCIADDGWRHIQLARPGVGSSGTRPTSSALDLTFHRRRAGRSGARPRDVCSPRWRRSPALAACAFGGHRGGPFRPARASRVDAAERGTPLACQKHLRAAGCRVHAFSRVSSRTTRSPFNDIGRPSPTFGDRERWSIWWAREPSGREGQGAYASNSR